MILLILLAVSRTSEIKLLDIYLKVDMKKQFYSYKVIIFYIKITYKSAFFRKMVFANGGQIYQQKDQFTVLSLVTLSR